jgi:hydroxypyruvate isomerase
VIRLSMPDNVWPLLPHRAVLDLIQTLAFDGVDLALSAQRSHIRPEIVRQDIAGWAGVVRERLESRNLVCSDVMALPSPDVKVMAVNNPDPEDQLESRSFFKDMLEFTVRVGSPGLTMRPGAVFGDETWERSVARSAPGLQWRVEEAAARGIRLSVEPHLPGNVDTPQKVLRLLEMTPGLTLRLDYSHFAYNGFTDSEIEVLLPFSRHFDLRAASKGNLQTKLDKSAIDHRRFVRRLREQGYVGFIGIEYAWKDAYDLNNVDTLAETIRLRDLVLKTLAEVADPVSA